jgi:Mg2+ and Co2+ transporter CorA
VIPTIQQALIDSIQVYATLQQRDNDLNRRYAADMRVITAITLVFLPGTFVATLFSASFWNFDPRSSGPLVSKWVWLYFFITIALTLIVLGVWRGYTILKGGMKKVKHFWHSNQLLGPVTRRKKQDDEETGKED